MRELWSEMVGAERTMATFLPKWFLISPSLMASGAFSLIIELKFLIPISPRALQAGEPQPDWNRVTVRDRMTQVPRNRWESCQAVEDERRNKGDKGISSFATGSGCNHSILSRLALMMN